MPDARLARARRSLPVGYQFGDCALYGQQEREMVTRRRARFLTEHGITELEAIRQARSSLAGQLREQGWNVIEGEEHQ